MKAVLAGSALAALALSLGPDTPAATPAETRPNVVVILVDDLDVESLETAVARGWMPKLETHLLRKGVWFSQCFTTFPLCCPSRVTYLTGQYAHNHEVLWNDGPAGGFDSFSDGRDERTIATLLQGSGYRTGHVGKYLNGYDTGKYVPPGWDEWHGLVDPSTYSMYNYTISHDGRRRRYGDCPRDYQTDVLAGLAAGFIRRSAGEEPFFLTVAPLAPHKESACVPACRAPTCCGTAPPCDSTRVRPAPRHAATPRLPLPAPPSLNEPAMDDKPCYLQRFPPIDEEHLEDLYNDRLAALRAVDDLVGTLVAALAQQRELASTAFLFTSDNGFLLGQHRLETKVVPYEESIRVPLVLRLPASANPVTIDGIALNNDLAPTIADLAGLSAESLPFDGRSLLPLVDGTATAWRVRFLVEHPPVAGQPFTLPPYAAVRTLGDGELGGASLLFAEYPPYTRGRCVRTGDTELYDLARDPFELRSLDAATGPVRRFQKRVLAEHLERLKTCGQGTCRALEE
jgi:N-acetylglucosamine-6-sulfatase